jgi:hypothetical protein
MAVINNFKRLNMADFDADSQELVQKLAISLNPMMDDLENVFNNNIDFSNLSQQYSTFTTSVDSAGKPTRGTELSFNINKSLKGMVCIRAENLTDSVAPTGQPFISFTLKDQVATVTSITGLPASKEWRLTVIMIGN